MTRTLTIHTTHIKPTIATRNCDWQATTNGYEPGHPIGFGRDEAEAVTDLYYQIAEREDSDRDRYEYEMGGKS